MALDPGGGGDVVPIHPEQCQFVKLTSLEVRYICDLLNWKDHNCMMQVCSDFKDYFEHVYGIHAYLPPRNFNLSTWSIMKLIMGRLMAGITRQITDDILGQKISNLERKVVRSLDMTEMHPEFNPFPFEQLIRYPYRMKEVSLKYVDVQFLIKILTSCRNLSTFRYKTGLQRHLPQGPVGWIMLRTSFQPVPIPLMKEQLIDFLTQLPQPHFQVRNLTSLSLRMETVTSQLNSDWANVLFLLLALSSSNLDNLRVFKFSFQFTYHHTLKDRLQIVACVGHFLSRCPNLQKLEYIAGLPPFYDWLWLGEDLNELDTPTGLPQNVIFGLIQKYGSDLLKQVQAPDTVGSKERIMVPMRKIMQEASMSLRNVRDASFQFVSLIEPHLFQILLSYSPSPVIERMVIEDYSGQRLSHPDYFPSLLPCEEHQPVQAYQKIEKLCIHRRYDFSNQNVIERTISLSRMLGVMRSLKHLEITPRIHIPDTEWMKENEWVGITKIHEPYYPFDPEVIEIEDDQGNLVNVDGGGRTPDITIEQVADQTIFHRVEVLKLAGVKLSLEAAARLSQWTNLKELFLLVLPEYQHDLFGIRSDDLLKMMGTLRRLDKLYANMLYLPQEPALNLVHRTALQEIGSLAEMHRWTFFQDDIDPEGWVHVYRTSPMKQYKFLFNCEEHEIIYDHNTNGMIYL